MIKDQGEAQVEREWHKQERREAQVPSPFGISNSFTPCYYSALTHWISQIL